MHNCKNKKSEIWKEASSYCRAVHALTQNFPEKEQSGLTDHLRRVSVLVAGNIAESKAQMPIAKGQMIYKKKI